MKVISSATARMIDERLVTDYHFTIEQLIEAAGAGIFHALQDLIPKDKQTLVVCGPGNNGGDGLIVLRYMAKAGYRTFGYIPWEFKKVHLIELHKQCKSFGIVFKTLENVFTSRYDFIIDAVYGFGFKPPLRADAASLLQGISKHADKIISIDVPSGWNVDSEEQKEEECILRPDILVSMTAPKPCSKAFNSGAHLVIDSFVPKTELFE